MNILHATKVEKGSLIPCIGWYFLLLMLFCQSTQAQWFEHKGTAMTTEIHLGFWYEGDDAAQLIERAMAEIYRIDRTYSSYRPESELSKVNQHAFAQAMPISDEFLQLLQRAYALSDITVGAFDITFNSVGHRYDYRAKEHPKDDEITALLPLVDYRHVLLDIDAKAVRFTQSGIKIGLGGIAKGYAVERVAAILQAAGVTAGQVTAGGDSRFIGDNHGRPWSVGIQDPRNASVLAAILPVINEAVSTSGDYARYFTKEGVRYHHILDPQTGQSARTVQSVTVLGPDGVMTDALSTGVFVLGVEKGLHLIDRLEAYEAVIVDNSGVLHYSQTFSKQ